MIDNMTDKMSGDFPENMAENMPADRPVKKELELYIHIPFCVKKCDYCDFLSFPAEENLQRDYLKNLIREIECSAYQLQDYEISTIFFGGGTPSYINPSWIRKILDTIRSEFSVREDAEISIECNPGTLTPEKLKIYMESGITRLSIGLQSADNNELKELGRIHTWEQFVESFQAAREAGFYNINVDLISGLPHQTAAGFQKTLKSVIRMKPAHISVYTLIIEEGTPFYKRYAADLERQKKGDPTTDLPDEEEEYRMYKLTQRMLEEAGFEQYEISNYARPEFACRHNIGYWTGVEYLGLGLGASSYLKGKRFSVIRDIHKYLEYMSELFRYAPIRNPRIVHGLRQYRENNAARAEELWKLLHDNTEEVTEKAAMEEFMFLGLRMTRGVSLKEFENRFHRTIRDVYGDQIIELQSRNFLEIKGGRCYLTKRGMDLGNYCMSEFLLD